MYSNPPPTASVAEVSTELSNFDHKHSRRIGPTSIGVAWIETLNFSRPNFRRSIQKTVFLSSDSIRKPSCTCSSCARRVKAKTSSGFDGRFSISAPSRTSDCLSPINSSPFSSRNSRRFSNAKRPSPSGSREKKNAERSRRLFIAPEREAVYILLRCSEASTSRQSSSRRPALTEIPK